MKKPEAIRVYTWLSPYGEIRYSPKLPCPDGFIHYSAPGVAKYGSEPGWVVYTGDDRAGTERTLDRALKACFGG